MSLRDVKTLPNDKEIWERSAVAIKRNSKMKITIKKRIRSTRKSRTFALLASIL
jgi:hypothetical protein